MWILYEMILAISYWQLWEKNCVFGCDFEVLWVRWGVVRVEYFGVKFGRFGAILSNDWKVDIECTLLSECTFFLDFGGKNFMTSVRVWFLDDGIAGNAWFLLDKFGWSGCFVLNNLYWFFEDFDWVRLKPYFIRAERYFEGIFDDFWWYRKWWKRWF